MNDDQAATVMAMMIRDGLSALVSTANRAAEAFDDPVYAERFSAVSKAISDLQGHPAVRAMNAPR